MKVLLFPNVCELVRVRRGSEVGFPVSYPLSSICQLASSSKWLFSGYVLTFAPTGILCFKLLNGVMNRKSPEGF
jgi:hypothetical protein